MKKYPFFYFILLLPLTGFCAGELEPLPQPLTLQYALEQAKNHSSVQLSGAQQQAAQARYFATEAQNALSVTLNGRLRWVDASPALADSSSADHALSLLAEKKLYDFGRSKARLQTAEHTLNAARTGLNKAEKEQRLEVMRAFFNVLLSDLAYTRDNEAMAIAYIRFDRRRTRHKLGQTGDLELAKQEYVYRQALSARQQSEQEQRASRARLANALGRPGQLPSILVSPEFPAWPVLPEVEALQKIALQNNLQVKQLHLKIQAAQTVTEEARAQSRPKLKAFAEANYWEKSFGSRDRALFSVQLEMPLYTGGRTQAAIAEARAQTEQLRVQLSETEYKVRQAVLDTWFEIKRLQTEAKEIEALTLFKDLQLDNNRTMYDLEFETDLGNSMVEQSAADLRRHENIYATVLAWERLKLLTGTESIEALVGSQKTEGPSKE